MSVNPEPIEQVSLRFQPDSHRLIPPPIIFGDWITVFGPDQG